MPRVYFDTRTVTPPPLSEANMGSHFESCFYFCLISIWGRSEFTLQSSLLHQVHLFIFISPYIENEIIFSTRAHTRTHAHTHTHARTHTYTRINWLRSESDQADMYIWHWDALRCGVGVGADLVGSAECLKQWQKRKSCPSESGQPEYTQWIIHNTVPYYLKCVICIQLLFFFILVIFFRVLLCPLREIRVALPWPSPLPLWTERGVVQILAGKEYQVQNSKRHKNHRKLIIRLRQPVTP